jgi:cytochrome c-type biogenesis protein CcmF
VLTSVHAFAVDPERGVVILAIMMLFIGGALALFALRAGELRQGGLFAPISREGSLVLNNILLTVSCATVLVGTLYPLALEAVTGDKISVGAPFFNLTFVPLMLPLLLALPFGPFLAWKRGDLMGAAQRLSIAAIVAVVVFVATIAWVQRGPWLAPFAIALGAFVMMGAVWEIAYRAKAGSAPWPEVSRRARNLPRSTWGTMLAHFGVGLAVIGIAATSAYRVETIAALKPGEHIETAGYTLTFKDARKAKGPNYTEDVITLEVSRGDQPVTVLTPAKRLYDAPPMPTTEAGILASWRGDLYAVVGDPQEGSGFAFRIYFNPLVRFIWLGALIMFVGGGISLSDRRLRVGAPVKARRRAKAAAA